MKYATQRMKGITSKMNFGKSRRRQQSFDAFLVWPPPIGWIASEFRTGIMAHCRSRNVVEIEMGLDNQPRGRNLGDIRDNVDRIF